mgnify:CR=1 FL=1
MSYFEPNDYFISIPFGAIKSFDNKNWRTVLYKFQFLLVRLKAFANTELTAQNFISIPFGAIKRINTRVVIIPE